MESRPFTATDAIAACWRRKKIVACIFLVIVTIVGAATILSPKSYKSEAKIFVRLGRENSALDVTAGLGENQVYSMPLNRDSEINSIAEMVQNRELFGRVVDRIGYERILKKPKSDKRHESDDKSETKDESDDAPGLIDATMAFLASIGVVNDLPQRERAIIKLEKKIDVDASEKSNVISIGFETYDPEFAQEVVAVIIEEYKTQHSRNHRSQGGNTFMSEQTEEVLEALEESETEFEQFKNKTNLISIEEQRKVMVDRVAKIQNELLDTDALVKAAESEVETLLTLTQNLSQSHAISQTEGAGNEAVDGMRQELFRLQVRREEMLATYPEEHPKVAQIEKQLNAAKAIFEKTASEMVELVQGPSKIYEGARMEIIQKEPALAALRSKSAALSSQLQQTLGELDGFNANEKEFIRLQRRMMICDENFKRYTRSLQQVTMDQSMQEHNLSNLSVFQPASMNPKPVRPNKIVNLIVGILLGFFGGCSVAVLLEYRKAIENRESELEAALDLPVLATVPNQPRRTLVQTG